MKRILFFCAFVLFSSILTAQVGINNEDPKAALDITASDAAIPAITDGILIPRIDEFPTGIGADQDGMLVFITGNGLPSKGFYYYNHSTTAWTSIAGAGGGTLDQAYDFGGAGAGNNINATDGALQINGDDGLVITGTFGSGNTIDTDAAGAGTRMFFNPNKAALRAGSVSGNEWNDANIGEYSTATGLNNTASGNMSFAGGTDNIASGETSVTFGVQNIASSNEAAAIGYQNTASGLRSFVFGSEATASGDYSFAGGEDALATATNAIAIGNGTRAAAADAVALGKTSEAQESLSTAIAGGTAQATHAVSIGDGTTALSYGEISVGIFNTGYLANDLTGFDGADRIFNVGNGTANGNRSDAFTILKNGNIGYGISDPQNRLEVGGSNDFDLSYFNSGQDGIFILGGNSGGLDAYGGSISFGPPSPTRSAQRKSVIASVQTSGDIDHTGLAFFVHGNAINQSDIQEGMRLTHDKRLGINNMAPSANLDVIGTLQYEDGNESNGYVLASDATGNATWTDPTTLISADDDWQDVGADIERQTGDVYIGDVAGTNNKLVISGVLEDWDNATYSIDPDSDTRMNEITFDNGDATDPSVHFGADTNTGFYRANLDEIGLSVDGTERIKFSNYGGIEFMNSQRGVYLGEFAGENDFNTDTTPFVNDNVFVGYSAGRTNDTGRSNSVVGSFALTANSSGRSNTAIGASSMLSNTTGNSNTGVGTGSMRSNEDGGNNVAVGLSSLNSNVSGDFNTAIGSLATPNLEGSSNTALGYRAGAADRNSSQNVYIGADAGGGDTSSSGTPEDKSGNVFIGYNAGYDENNSNRLVIENSNSTSPLIYGEFDNDIARINGELQIGDASSTGYALPTNQGTSGDVLISNGDGTTQWSSPADVRSIVRANLSGFQSLPGNVFTQLQLNTVVFDTNNDFDTTNYRYVAPRTGYYEFNANFVGIRSSGSGICYITVYKNGSLYQRNNDTTIGANITRGTHGLVQLNAGDYLEVFVGTDSATWSASSASGYTFFDIKELRL